MRNYFPQAFLASVFFFCGSGSLMAAEAARVLSVTAHRPDAGVAIDINFDRPVAARSLKPTYERDMIQIVLKNTKTDSAKIIPVPQSQVQKVFAYAYSPDVARVRVILRKPGQWAKSRLAVWNNGPKSVRVFIKDPKTEAVSEVSAVEKSSGAPKSAAVGKPSPGEASSVAERQALAVDRSLVKDVVSNTRDIDINNPDSVKAALSERPKEPAQAAANPAPARGESEASAPIGVRVDPTRQFMRMVVALLAVVSLFVGIVLLVRKYAVKLKKLPFGKKERLIQVVATHYLGGKKSISLVKITGEFMVVGVSNDGISLISKLGPEVNVEKYLEDRFWGGTFEKHLDSYAGDPASIKKIDLADQGAAAVPSVRSSIKEKLTKLKPLA